MGTLDRLAARIGGSFESSFTIATVQSVQSTTLTCRISEGSVPTDVPGVLRENGVTYVAGEKVLLVRLPGDHRIAIMTIQE